MTDEVQNLAEVDSAPAPEVTATSDNAQNLPEVADQSNETPEEKKFSQAELDSMIGKRLAREQRKWEREQQARLAERQVAQSVPKELPPVDQFESPEAYAEALAVKRAEEMLHQRELQKQKAAIEDSYAEREEEVRNKYDDFEQVAYNPNLRVTDVMAETIKSSDIGPDLAYWLGSNPKEADRISRLSPLLQAREIGKIEAKITAEPFQKKTSSAPEPIRPVTARAVNPGVTDTTDPRSVKTMSTSDWIAAERQRQMDKARALRNR
ncbi:scaffolding protein [Phage DSL-LC05]|nr:scaffolding protein [Phage DSL-LC05]